MFNNILDLLLSSVNRTEAMRAQLLLLFNPEKAWKELSDSPAKQQYLLPLLVYPLLLLAAASSYIQYEYGYISLSEATQEAVLSLIKFWACIVTTRIVMNALSHRYYKMTCNAQQIHLFTGYTFTIALLAALVSNLLPCPFTFIEFAPMYMIWVIYKGKDYLNVEEEDTLNFVVTTSALLLGLPFVWNSILHMIVD